ncbi:MAG: hypothetical protein ABR501_04400 [Pyrinomonadaceae bacterium]
MSSKFRNTFSIKKSIIERKHFNEFRRFLKKYEINYDERYVWD